MSDDDLYDDDLDADDDQTGTPEPPAAVKEQEPGWAKRLRREFDKAKQERDSLRSENALLRADLGPLSERQVKAVLATVDGDITADTLRAAATDLGFIAAPQEDDGQQAAADESANVQTRIANANSGAHTLQAQPSAVEQADAALADGRVREAIALKTGALLAQLNQ